MGACRISKDSLKFHIGFTTPKGVNRYREAQPLREPTGRKESDNYSGES